MVAVSRLVGVADRGLHALTRLWTMTVTTDALSPPASLVEGQAEGLPPISVAYERHGAGEPVVLLHGLGLNRHVWNTVVPMLAAEREVISIDLPGFGQSPEWPQSVPRDLSSAAAALGAIFATLGIERPHVVGHSLGGLIALRLGQAGLARSVTALAPAGFWNEAERRYAFTVLSAARRIARTLPDTTVRRLTETPVARAVLTGMIYANAAKCPPGAIDTCLRALREATGFEATLRAGRVPGLFTGRISDMPVTLAWGLADRILLPRQARRAAAMLPKARLIWLPRCGHIPMNDEPGLVADVILGATNASTRANR
jgi:pimeloyl-ACP methyl ester carboxylesterase